MKTPPMLRQVAGIAAFAAVVFVMVESVIVQVEAGYAHEQLGGCGPARALVLYHPSRDARFGDDLSLAVARGFQDAHLSVDRATMTGDTPPSPAGYAIIAVVSNTYYWTPDRPTLRYLRRARLEGTPVIGLMAGAGSTGRAERILEEALRATGAQAVETRSFWLLRPNDESRPHESNRALATDLAQSFAAEAAHKLLP